MARTTTTAKIKLPPKLVPVFSTTGKFVRGAYGGRGSAKTRSFALMTAVRAYMFAEAGVSGVILCAREFMNSLEESSMEEIKQAIRSEPWLEAYFEIGEKFIRTKNRRVSYVFTGLHTNLNSLKSKARIILAWIEEAEDVSEIAWQKLIPTIRGIDDAELWLTWNPEKDGSPTDTRFRKQLDDDMIIVEMNYTDNPWFPAVLERARLKDRKNLDDSTYAWIWDGQYLKNSKAQILSGKYVVVDFVANPNTWDGPYYGLDWGFSQDPTAGVKCWINRDYLYVEYEGGKVGLENDGIAEYMIKRLPGIEKHSVRADSARPETISHVKSTGGGKRKNLPQIEGVVKWKGSVEDGIAHLRSYKKIIIHSRCKETINEARNYSYKVDRLTGDVLTVIVDKFNHYIDAIRYALAPLIRARTNKGVMLPKRYQKRK